MFIDFLYEEDKEYITQIRNPEVEDGIVVLVDGVYAPVSRGVLNQLLFNPFIRVWKDNVGSSEEEYKYWRVQE